MTDIAAGVLLCVEPRRVAHEPATGRPVTSRARWNTELALSVLGLTLVIASAPVRNVQYVLPWVVATHMALAGRHRLLVRLIALTASLAASSVVVALASLQEVNPSGFVWGAVTYGTLLMWIAWPRTEFTELDLVRFGSRGSDVVSMFIAVQTLVGMAQFLWSTQPDRPDSVTGTLDPLWFRTGGSSLSQPSLAVAMVGALLFVAAFGDRRRHRVAVTAGTGCLLVSQSGHQLIFLLAAAAVVAVGVDFRGRTLLRLAGGFLCLVVAVQVLAPNTISRAPTWFDRVIVSEDSPKRQIWTDAGELTTELAVPGAGIGAGQFSSRAGLISSGDYLSVGLPDVLTGKSSVFGDRVEPLLESFDRVGEGSAISKPYSSATSVVVELGPMAAFLLAGLGLAAVFNDIVRARRVGGLERRVRACLAIGLLFVFGISLVENYLEVPQAVFLPGVLYLMGRGAAASLAHQHELR